MINYIIMYYWTLKNTFSSKLLFLKPILDLNIKKNNEFKYIDNFGKVISNNFEILNYKKFTFNTSSINANLYAIQNDWKYPFPNNYVPIFYNKFKLDMLLNYNNKMYIIRELIKTNIHDKSPYDITFSYQLFLNDDFIESRKIKGEMNYKTLQASLITNYKAKELFKFFDNEIKKR
jgi:hypothetical protein